MLLNQLIFMFMPNPNKNAIPLFTGQGVVKTYASPTHSRSSLMTSILLVFTALSVPVMMFVKPVVLWYRNKQKKTYTLLPNVNNSDSSQGTINLPIFMDWFHNTKSPPHLTLI